MDDKNKNDAKKADDEDLLAGVVEVKLEKIAAEPNWVPDEGLGGMVILDPDPDYRVDSLPVPVAASAGDPGDEDEVAEQLPAPPPA